MSFSNHDVLYSNQNHQEYMNDGFGGQYRIATYMEKNLRIEGSHDLNRQVL